VYRKKNEIPPAVDPSLLVPTDSCRHAGVLISSRNMLP